MAKLKEMASVAELESSCNFSTSPGYNLQPQVLEVAFLKLVTFVYNAPKFLQHAHINFHGSMQERVQYTFIFYLYTFSFVLYILIA